MSLRYGSYYYQVIPPVDLVMTDGGATHLQVADNVPLSVPLIVSDAVHLQVASNVDLGNASLQVQASDHLQVADSVVLTVNLIVASTYHIHAPPNIGLIVPILVQDTYHDNLPDLSRIYQTHYLSSLADIVHLQDVAGTVLVAISTLVLAPSGYYSAEISHNQIPDSANGPTVLKLTGTHILAPAETYHAQVVDNVAPLSEGIKVNDSAHLQVADSVKLVEVYFLAPIAPYHLQVADSPTFAVGMTAVSDCVHIQAAEAISAVVEAHTLTVADSVHLQAATSPEISPLLEIQGTIHLQVAETAGTRLAQTHYLDMTGSEDNIHLQVADNITFVALPKDLRFLQIVKYAA